MRKPLSQRFPKTSAFISKTNTKILNFSDWFMPPQYDRLAYGFAGIRDAPVKKPDPTRLPQLERKLSKEEQTRKELQGVMYDINPEYFGAPIGGLIDQHAKWAQEQAQKNYNPNTGGSGSKSSSSGSGHIPYFPPSQQADQPVVEVFCPKLSDPAEDEKKMFKWLHNHFRNGSKEPDPLGLTKKILQNAKQTKEPEETTKNKLSGVFLDILRSYSSPKHKYEYALESLELAFIIPRSYWGDGFFEWIRDTASRTISSESESNITGSLSPLTSGEKCELLLLISAGYPLTAGYPLRLLKFMNLMNSMEGADRDRVIHTLYDYFYSHPSNYNLYSAELNSLLSEAQKRAILNRTLDDPNMSFSKKKNIMGKLRAPGRKSPKNISLLISHMISRDVHLAATAIVGAAALIIGAVYGVQGIRQLQEENKIKPYTKDVNKHPQSSSVYLSRANMYYFLENYGKAVEDYTLALQLDSNLAAAYYWRGKCYFELDEFRKSVEEYTKLIELEPNNADAYGARSSAYFELNMPKKAWEDVGTGFGLAKAYYEELNDAAKADRKKANMDNYNNESWIDRELRYFMQNIRKKLMK